MSDGEANRGPVRVLVVDDDRGVRQMITEVLGAEGYIVEPATDGDEAITSARREPPHLILLDVNMPRVDGWQVLEELRATAGPQTSVVVMTAGFDAQDRALASGAQGYLAKPFDLDDLISTVEAHAGLLVHSGMEEAVTGRTEAAYGPI